MSLDELEHNATPESDAELLRREAESDGKALSDIIYTSGTTGRSKGVMLTHDMVLRAAYSSAFTRAFEDGRRILFAIIPQVVFDPVEMLELAEAKSASEMVCVPMMTAKLIEIARNRGFDSTHLQTMFNSGGINPPSIWNEIHAVLRPRETVTGYGMTETTASTTCTLPEDDRNRLLTSNGRYKLACAAGDPALGGLVAEYKAIDPATGADLQQGEEGELVVRGPIVTHGYYKNTEETAAAFTPDGWLRTGDIGNIGEDGYLVLTGRIKEAFRCNGEMVMPREIEELFDDHPDIEQALVVGVPDRRAGETGCLCIVPKPGVDLDFQMLIAHCEQRLARFKVPRHVLVMAASDIPLTVTGRPQKFKLAKLATERLTAEKGESK
jgi:fatty-acyl-CoA synthase